MFQAIFYQRYNDTKRQYLYKLVDSEFGVCEIWVDGTASGTGVFGAEKEIAQEYQKRKLPIAENIVLLNIWHHKRYGYSLNEMKEYQDTYCYKHINNWPEISLKIDRLIKKYLLLQ